MSQLAQLLQDEAPDLVHRWMERLKLGVAPEALTEPELRDFIPRFLEELRAALRAGTSPRSVLVAKEHGLQREKLGFDVDAIVREYGLLSSTILDRAEEKALGLTMVEVRILTDVMSFLASASQRATATVAPSTSTGAPVKLTVAPGNTVTNAVSI